MCAPVPLPFDVLTHSHSTDGLWPSAPIIRTLMTNARKALLLCVRVREWRQDRGIRRMVGWVKGKNAVQRSLSYIPLFHNRLTVLKIYILWIYSGLSPIHASFSPIHIFRSNLFWVSPENTLDLEKGVEFPWWPFLNTFSRILSVMNQNQILQVWPEVGVRSQSAGNGILSFLQCIIWV